MLFKNSTIGIASMLFFVVLVSQSRILDFLFETFLGRILLISMILFISYTHYILGVVSVLIVIIMFNNIDYGYGYGYGYMEGMENAQKPTTTTTSSTTVPTTTTATTTTDTPSVSSSLATAMNKAKDSVMSKINVSTTTPSTSTTASSTTASSKKEKTSTEGFDLIGTENTIKRGKQSNSIPVHSQSNSGGRIAPYDGGSVYSSF
jgi:hypothetical protein